MRTNRRYLYTAWYSKGVRNHTLGLAEENFIVYQGECFRCALIRGCWYMEAGYVFTRSRISYVISLWSTFDSL